MLFCAGMYFRDHAEAVEVSLNIKTFAVREIYWNDIKVRVNCEWNKVEVCVNGLCFEVSATLI